MPIPLIIMAGIRIGMVLLRSQGAKAAAQQAGKQAAQKQGQSMAAQAGPRGANQVAEKGAGAAGKPSPSDMLGNAANLGGLGSMFMPPGQESGQTRKPVSKYESQLGG